MNCPNWVDEVISTFDTKRTPHSEIQLVDALDQARKPHGDLSDEDFKAYVAERSAFFFRGHPDNDGAWGTFFGPMAIASREDGTEVRVPDIKELDIEVVVHWEQRSRSAMSPVMRARYADLVWDLKRTITNERPSHEYAQIAIDSYLEAVREKFFTMGVEGVRWLRRALDIALSIRDKDRVDQVITSIVQFPEHAGDAPRAGVWLLPFDSLYGRKGLLSPEQEANIIFQLEAMLARTALGKPEEFDPHGAQAAAERLAQHYKRQNDRANSERVIRTYGQAFERISKDASPLLASAWLQPVIERYEQEGMKQEAERLQLLYADKARNVHSDLKQVSATATIEKREIEEHVEKLIEGDLKTALRRIAAYFVPDVGRARVMLEQMKLQAPLLSRIPVGFVEKDGHTSARVGSVEEDPDGRLHMQLGQTMGFYQPILVLALERLRENYHPSVDDILGFLSESPLFAKCDLTLLREGLDSYANEDFVKTVHVMVPQIEHLLRNFLGVLGVPTLKTVRNYPGIMDAKGMNDILTDERMREVLTESLWRYLTVVFIEKKGGLNLRNDLAHGLLPPNAFNRQIADRVFHCLLALSLIRKREDAGAMHRNEN